MIFKNFPTLAKTNSGPLSSVSYNCSGNFQMFLSESSEFTFPSFLLTVEQETILYKKFRLKNDQISLKLLESILH